MVSFAPHRNSHVGTVEGIVLLGFLFIRGGPLGSHLSLFYFQPLLLRYGGEDLGVSFETPQAGFFGGRSHPS